MNSNLRRTAIFIVVCYFVLWFVGAMFNFLPFPGNDLTLCAIGFTGLLLCLVIVMCTCWIIEEIRKDK